MCMISFLCILIRDITSWYLYPFQVEERKLKKTIYQILVIEVSKIINLPVYQLSNHTDNFEIMIYKLQR